MQALGENIQMLSELTGKGSFFCPMIKADGYGHGALAVAKKVQSIGIKKAGVVSVEEALQLKELSKDMEIYVFGPFDKSQVNAIDTYGFIPVIGQWENLRDLSFSKKKEICFHIKFNLGMNRLGFAPSEAPALIKHIQNSPSLKLTGICSRLSEGEAVGWEEKHSQTIRKTILFKKICDQFGNSFSTSDLQFHLLGSAGWWALWSHSRLDSKLGFRPGICLYGVKPPLLFASQAAKKKYKSIQLKNVFCLKSFVVQSHFLSAGQTVSYGGTWRAKKKSLLAVVSMGYADGLPYNLSNKAEVLFRGKRVPIAGRVCMDFFMIDVTGVWNKQTVKKGEEIVIFGFQGDSFISIEEQAKKADSIPYELLTRIGHRVHRMYF